MRPPVELHRLISTALKAPTLIARLSSEPEKVYIEFGIPEWQRKALADDPVAALPLIGVHPNLQFKFLTLLNLLKLSPASAKPFLESLRISNGTNS